MMEDFVGVLKTCCMAATLAIIPAEHNTVRAEKRK
jgi:hypothetical protein